MPLLVSFMARLIFPFGFSTIAGGDVLGHLNSCAEDLRSLSQPFLLAAVHNTKAQRAINDGKTRTRESKNDAEPRWYDEMINDFRVHASDMTA